MVSLHSFYLLDKVTLLELKPFLFRVLKNTVMYSKPKGIFRLILHWNDKFYYHLHGLLITVTDLKSLNCPTINHGSLYGKVSNFLQRMEV